MATAQRRPRADLIRQLAQAPHRFDLFQAVRLLELAQPQSARAVRFRASHALHFAGADIVSAEAPTDEAGDGWQLLVNVLTLVGSSGVLPHHYSELLLQRDRARDDTLGVFLDLFNDRSVALLVEAWRKYRLPQNYERHQRAGRRDRDPISTALAAIAGLGTARLDEQLPIATEALLGSGGVLGRLVKSASSLRSLLRHYLQLPVEIEQFRGQWQPLPEDLRTRLPGDGQRGMNHRLGLNAILGAECWQVQSKFRVRIRVATYAQLMELAPGGEKMRTLKTLTQFVAGIELDYDIAIDVDCHDLPPLQLLPASSEQRPLLGWNSRMPLGSPKNSRDEHQEVLVMVSQSLV